MGILPAAHRGLDLLGRQDQGAATPTAEFADRIELRQDGRIVGQDPRVFGRGQTVYDPWHYVPVLARKPGALR